MWYREAVTRVDPSGQINMDFPDVKPKPFDLKNVKFEINEPYPDTYSITANIYGKRIKSYSKSSNRFHISNDFIESRIE